MLGGVEMLRDVTLGERVALTGKVVVIGGGNVAFDVARTVITRRESTFLGRRFGNPASRKSICAVWRVSKSCRPATKRFLRPMRKA